MDTDKAQGVGSVVVPHKGLPLTPVEKQGFIKRMLGQFAGRDFWEEVFALLVRESVAAIISAIGGTLITVASEKRSAASARIKGVIDQAGNSAASRSPNGAFSSGFTPQATYRPSYPAGTPAGNPPPPPFPGF